MKLTNLKHPKTLVAGVFACAAMALSLAGTAKPASADSWGFDIHIGGGDRGRYYERDRCDDWRYRRDDYRWRDPRCDDRRWEYRRDDWRWRHDYDRHAHGYGYGYGRPWR
jgi:hypothetical protein